MSLRGHPDYVTPVSQVYIEGLVGLEELAARLGSIVPWDIEGNVVLMEDFETELTEWVSDCDGLGSTATRSSRHKYSGDWSAKLYNVGGVGAGADLYRYLHYPGLLKYAIFARWCWDENCKTIFLSAILRSGSKEFYIEFTYDLLTTTLSVLTTDGDQHDVDTALTLSEDTHVWYPALITADLAAEKYDKLYFADKEYDISDVDLLVTSEALLPDGIIRVGAISGGGATFTAYVDGVILAKNVP